MEKSDIPCEQQRLMCDGRTLHMDDRFIAQAYGIKSGLTTTVDGSGWARRWSCLPVLRSLSEASGKNAYHRFDEKESGKAKWLLLKITTEPLGAGSSEDGICAICLTSYSSEGCSTLPCRHMYHSQCITEWLSHNPTCPPLCVVLWQV